MDKFLKALERKDSQLEKFQEQIDRLISIIEVLTHEVEKEKKEKNKIYLIPRRDKEKI